MGIAVRHLLLVELVGALLGVRDAGSALGVRVRSFACTQQGSNGMGRWWWAEEGHHQSSSGIVIIGSQIHEAAFFLGILNALGHPF